VYVHPPITEAVIGINFVDRLSDGDLSSIRDKLSTNYPVHQPVENLNLRFQIDAGKDNKKTANAQIDSETTYRLVTADMSELVVLLPQSIIVSQTAPYPGWAYFYKRFIRDWKMVRRVLGFRLLSRIGVRYINRIDIPTEAGVVDHEKYLNLYPKVTDKYGPLTAYALQAEMFMEDLHCKLMLNSAAVPSPLLHTASFLIDQDISREDRVPQKDDQIYELIAQIRERKNDVFESCVTDDARSLFRYVE
jgi:uncharacterized protein (TIGR04255 family)